MGAGKSTVGALVSARLLWSFHDADAVLESTHGLSVAEVFRQHGESHFRALEESTIRGLLSRPLAVIALGGGALESAATRTLLEHAAGGMHLVFLETPLAVALARCCAVDTERPLLENRDSLEQRYALRLPFYRRAHQTIDTSLVAPEEAARLIVDAVLDRTRAPSEM